MSRADYDTEARELTDWLFAQADIYRKFAPGLTDDIRRFEDAAALIDSYRAGLTLVDPHPSMRAEVVRWVSVTQYLPLDEETVLIIPSGEAEVFIGYLYGGVWYHDSTSEVKGDVLYWAKFPADQQMHDAMTEQVQP